MIGLANSDLSELDKRLVKSKTKKLHKKGRRVSIGLEPSKVRISVKHPNGSLISPSSKKKRGKRRGSVKAKDSNIVDLTSTFNDKRRTLERGHDTTGLISATE